MMPQLPVKKSNIWSLVFILYIIYYAQGVFLPTGSIFPQIIILFIMLLGLAYGIKVLKSEKTIPTVYWILLMILCLSITFAFSPKRVDSVLLKAGYVETFQQFKSSCIFFFSFVIGYYIGLTRQLPSTQILRTALAMIIISLFQYSIAFKSMTMNHDADEVTNNASYYFLYIVPYALFLIKSKKRIAVVLLGIILFFIVSGAKRGAILCLLLSGLYYIWWAFKYDKMNIKTFISLSLVIMIIGIYVQYAFTHSEYLQQRLESTLEGNSSTRDILYAVFLNKWIDSDFTHQLFGYGSAQTVGIAGNFAHNDWLELLINNGFLGAFIYLMIFVSIIFFIKRHPPTPIIRLVLMVSMIIWFFKSLISMGYSSAAAGMDMMLIGLLMANINRNIRT